MSHDYPHASGADSGKNIRHHNILAFHKLTDRVTFGSTNYSPDRLIRLFDALIDSGFRFVSLKEVLEKDDTKNIGVTFDDGYAHLLEHLPAIIEKHNLRPTVFIPTLFIGKDNRWDYSNLLRAERHLSKEQIIELVSIGVEFGSHGHSHIDLTTANKETIERELRISKNVLEDITGQRVGSISFPFGRTDSRVKHLAAGAGYEFGFTISLPRQSDDRFSLGRIPVYFFDYCGSVLHRLKRGKFYNLHNALCGGVNNLSRGTVLLNRVLGRGED